MRKAGGVGSIGVMVVTEYGTIGAGGRTLSRALLPGPSVRGGLGGKGAGSTGGDPISRLGLPDVSRNFSLRRR